LSRESTLPSNFPARKESAELAVASNPTTAFESTLNAANLFLWLSGSNLFFLAADRITEIIMPQSEQIIYSDNRQFVLWRRARLLPLYQLSALCQDNNPLPANHPSPAAPESSSILVIDRDRSLLALKIDIERLVVASELTLKSFSPLLETTPDYLAGCIWLEDERIVTAIDVLALLRHHSIVRVENSL
jgi:chemotaxis family two-component system sensor histidine kinase/response regulator PixL